MTTNRIVPAVSAVIIIGLILSACTVIAPSPETKSTPLKIIPSATVTPEMTVTPEPTKIEEHELIRDMWNAIDTEYKGVRIKGDL